MKEENIQEAYELAANKYTLEACIRMIENAKDISDVENVFRRSNLNFTLPSMDVIKQEFIKIANGEIEIINNKIEAL